MIETKQIATNGEQLAGSKSPIKEMDKEELEFHRMNTCLECCD